MSLDALLAGEFSIIEVNGATSEFIHIYDDKFTYKEGVSELKRQWSLLFDISACNQNKRPYPSFWLFCWQYVKFFRKTKQAVGTLW